MWCSIRVCGIVAVLLILSGIEVNAVNNVNGVCDMYGLGSTAILFREPAAYFNLISMNSADVRFLHYPYASKPDSFEEIEAFNLVSLKTFRFGPSKPVKILIHGFLSSADGVYPQNVKDAYLEVDKTNTYNVIAVDWSKLAKPSSIASCTLYPAVVENVPDAGKRVGEVIIWLRDAAGVDLSKFHLVGHSLGAHVSGWAGSTVYEKTGVKVGRITALDPAGPLFYTNLFIKSLDKGNALFVDAYHTNALQLGQYDSAAHVDFYLNGGTSQPGCSLDTSGICSDSRCHEIFTQIILEGPSTKSCACDAFSYLRSQDSCCNVKLAVGEYCSERTAGEFYVKYNYNLTLVKLYLGR